MPKIHFLFYSLIIISAFSCKQNPSINEKPSSMSVNETDSVSHKIVVYQVFTRLFGNTNPNNKPWGTIEENGVGKFADFTDKALNEIKDLGVTHICIQAFLIMR